MRLEGAARRGRRFREEAFHRARERAAVGGPQDRRHRREAHGGRRRGALQPPTVAPQDEHNVSQGEGDLWWKTPTSRETLLLMFSP